MLRSWTGILVAGLLLCGAAGARANIGATFTVNTTADDQFSPALGTTGTYRQAILFAQANPNTTIQFAAALANQTIALQSQLPDVPAGATIDGTVPVGTTLTTATTGGGNLNFINTLRVNVSTGTFFEADPLNYSSTNTTVPGGLTKTGAGTLIVPSLSLFSGLPGTGVDIQGGSLQTNSGDYLTGQLNVATGASLVINESNTTVFGAAISGGGQLVKIGSGQVGLSNAANSYTGGTVLLAGVLNIANDGALGGGSVTFNGGTLATSGAIGSMRSYFLAAGGGTIRVDGGLLQQGGNVTGPGGLTKIGPGTLELAGFTSFAGLTNVNNGVLLLSGDTTQNQSATTVNSGATLQVLGSQFIGSLAGEGNVALSGALTAGSNGSSTTFNGGMTDVNGGSFIKVGAGVLTFGPNIAYGGQTIVQEGTLNVLGNLTGAVNVSTGAALSGSGSVGNTVIDGRIIPGTGLGNQELTVTGSTFNLNGTLVSTITKAGTADRVNDTGGIALIGGAATVDVRGAGVPGQTYNILHSDVEVQGSFSGVTSQIQNFHGELSYGGTNTATTDVFLTLVLNNNAFTDRALNQNQREVARALESAFNTSDVQSLIFDMATVPLDFIPHLLQELSGDFLAGLPVIQLKLMNQFQTMTSDRTHELVRLEFHKVPAATAGMSAPSGTMLGAPAFPVPGSRAPSDGHEWSAWARGFGLHGAIDSDGQATGISFTNSGAMVGFDKRISRRAFLGFSGGFVDGDSHAFDVAASQNNDGYVLGSYGGYDLGDDVYLLTSSLFTHVDNRSTRQIFFGGTQAIALGSFTGNGFSSYVEAGKHLRCGQTNIDPLVSLEYDRANQTGFNETGAGLLNLNVGSTHATNFLGSIGLRISRTYVSENSTTWTPELRARYVHNFDDDRPVFQSALPGLSPTLFTIQGARPQQDYALLGASVTGHLNDTWDLYVSYNGQFADEQELHSGEGGFRVRF
jgi:fibronectin-binding autotransporter adhesin